MPRKFIGKALTEEDGGAPTKAKSGHDVSCPYEEKINEVPTGEGAAVLRPYKSRSTGEPQDPGSKCEPGAPGGRAKALPYEGKAIAAESCRVQT